MKCQPGAAEAYATSTRKVATFTSILIMIGLIWLAVLPAIAVHPNMRARIDWLKDKGIDPNAMYYTDLEMMDEILSR